MHAEEMTVKRLAKPIPQLRVQTQMLQWTAITPIIVLAAERIQACLQLKCPMTGEINFSPQIKRVSSPIRNLGEAMSLKWTIFTFIDSLSQLKRNFYTLQIPPEYQKQIIQ